MPKIPSEQLRSLSLDILHAAGVPEPDAEIVGNHLVESNLAGVDSHGIIRLPQYVEAVQTGRVIPGVQPTTLRETPSGALMDGNQGFGQVMAQRAMELAIDKAAKTSVSAVTLYNCGHTGRLAGYAGMAAETAMIGIMMANAGGGGQSVCPFGGIDRRLATNPICCAMPGGKVGRIVLDIATSIVPEGRIRQLHSSGQPAAEGWIIDSRGNPTTDPGDFYGPPPGALLPLGSAAGHKGFGLGLVVDLLAGGLSMAGCCRADAPEVPTGDGVLAMAIDISSFTPLEDFLHHVDGLVDHVKSSRLNPGYREILVPGEPESRAREDRVRNGVPVDEATWLQIEDTAAALGVPIQLGGGTEG
jgi:uncharacterized oxidoreductase